MEMDEIEIKDIIELDYFSEFLPEIYHNGNIYVEEIKLQKPTVIGEEECVKEEPVSQPNVIQSALEDIDTDEEPVINSKDISQVQDEDISVCSEQPQPLIQKKLSGEVIAKLELLWRILLAVVYEGEDFQKLINIFESLQEEIIKQCFQEEYQIEEEEDDTITKYPIVDQVERLNYQEFVKPHQDMDLEKFKAEAQDFPELLKWLSKVENSEIVTSLCGVIGSNLETIKSAKQRPQKLMELESNFENVVNFKQLKDSGIYTDVSIRGVLENQTKTDELRDKILNTCQSIGLQIGPFKQFRDQCQSELEDTINVENQIINYESKLEQSIECAKKLIVICDQKQVEKDDKFQKLMEANQQDVELLEESVDKQNKELIEMIRTLVKKKKSLIQTQQLLAVFKAKGAKLMDLFNLINDEMKTRKDNIQRVLDEDIKNLEITREVKRAHQETIHEDGQKITCRNIQIAEQIYNAKEQEGKQDFGDFGIWLLTRIYNHTNVNIGKISRDGDRIIDEEEDFKVQLSPLEPDDYPEDMKSDFQKLQSKKKVNSLTLQKYESKLEYWEDALMVISRHLQQWTDDKILLSPLIEETQDKYALTVSQRIVQLLLKLNDHINKLYDSVMNNNLKDDVDGIEKKLVFYLTYIEQVARSMELSDINRPKIRPALQELKKQIKIFQDKSQDYLDDNFKSLYEDHCNCTCWSTMINYHQQVLQHLELIFASDQLLLTN